MKIKKILNIFIKKERKYKYGYLSVKYFLFKFIPIFEIEINKNYFRDEEN